MIQPLDKLFEMLNRLYFSRDQAFVFELFKSEINKVANTYFQPGQSYTDHDLFFQRFTVVWLDLLNRRRYPEAEYIWKFALGPAFQWENNNEPNKIHKGTPYYFWGVTAILNDKLEDGFLQMHQALEEDRKNIQPQAPQTPAYFFVTLDDSKIGQFFRPKVVEIGQYLFERMEEYRKTRNGTLDRSGFKAKFLECTDLSEEVFLLVYLLFKLKKLVETDIEQKRNVFSSLLHAKALFDICLVVEKVIEHKNPRSATKGAKLYFSDEIGFLSQKTSLMLVSHIGKLNNDFDGDFAGTLSDILDSKYAPTLSSIEEDLAIAYGIRNFGAHKLENQPVLCQRMVELSQRLLNALFFSIEKLY